VSSSLFLFTTLPEGEEKEGRGPSPYFLAVQEKRDPPIRLPYPRGGGLDRRFGPKGKE